MTMLEYAAPPALDLLSDLGRRIIGAEDADTLRENANLNGDSFSGKMSRLGSETAKWHAMRHVLPAALAEAVESGDLYVHDLDQYALGTTNCIFIPFDRSRWLPASIPGMGLFAPPDDYVCDGTGRDHLPIPAK